MKMRDFFKRWMEQEGVHTPKHVCARFRLIHGGRPFAILELKDGKWTFRYTEEFHKAPRLRPLVGFPDTKKTYSSDELWPFFAMRIPSLKQEQVSRIVQQEDIDREDEVQLLRRFGRKSVANPFELVEAESDS